MPRRRQLVKYWAGTVPAGSIPRDSTPSRFRLGPEEFALQARVKAMHHWIKKGDDLRAFHRAKEVFHTILTHMRREGE